MGEYSRASDFEIASLKKKQQTDYDLMIPGRGIAWEDRGAIGFVPAFFRTAFATLFGHSGLLDHIRRPEITGEASGFALGCGLLWGVSVVIWDALRYWHYSSEPGKFVISDNQYWLETALEFGAVTVGVFLLLRLGSRLFTSLVNNSSPRPVPSVLVYNVFAYSLGPSVLAVIPVLGWVIALPWIFINTLIGAKSRLYLKTREAIINGILVWVVLLALSAGAYFGVWFLWTRVLAEPSVAPPAPVERPHRP